MTQNRMPPSLFLLMHWRAYLMSSERAAILTWIRQTRRNYYATPDVAPQHAEEVIQPIPEQIQANWDRAALGKKLFFERRLSGDGKLNCASCHGLDKAGVDNLKTATGINGKKGPINSPTVYNAVFNIAQFWDGRAVDLAAQAAGPVTNPLEMGAHDWDTVVATLKSDPEYVADFQRIYGSDALTKENITNAIAEYERTLITPDSPFDLYLKGDDNAITMQEKHGYALFKQVGCSGCHSGVALGGDAYEVMGLEGPYFSDRNTPLTQADIGRQSFTKALSDFHRFKVPNLRNVALTAPYFHDGSAPTLDDAVKKMVRYQTPADMRTPSRQRLKTAPRQDMSPRRTIVPTPKIEIGARLPGLDNTSWRALLKEKKAAQRKLDLHGFAARKAFHALHDFFIQSHRDEIRYVEVIAGLGGGGGVLRRELPHWLERHELRPLILGVVYTHRANKGAVRILLCAGRSRTPNAVIGHNRTLERAAKKTASFPDQVASAED